MSEKNKEKTGAGTNAAEAGSKADTAKADASLEELKSVDPVAVGLTREEFLEALARLEKSNEGQEKYARKQYHMSLISALASVVGLVVVLYIAVTLMPRINLVLDDVNSAMANLIKITNDLAAVDMQGMASDIDSLVATSEKSINEAMGKLLAIDFDGLNQAIEDLGNVIAPIARLFGGR